MTLAAQATAAMLGAAFNSPWQIVAMLTVAVVIVVLATYVLIAWKGIAPRVKIRERTTIEFERLAPADDRPDPSDDV